MSKKFSKKLVYVKRLISLIIMIFLLFVFTIVLASDTFYALTLNILNRKHDAPFYIAIYDNKKSFLKPVLAKYAFLVDSNEQDIYTFNNISAGTYAIVIFQDINKNGNLDSTLLGIPKEPFGFSNNPRLLLGPPSFKVCQIQLLDNTMIKIKLR